MNSKLLVNDTIRSGQEEVDDYIELLESIVVAYTSDNATRMVAEANRVIGILADDLSLIAEDGSVKGTKLIKAEKNNMMVDRIVLILKQADTISSVSRKAVSIGKEIAVSLLGEEKEQVVTEKQQAQQDLKDEQDDDLITSDIPAIEMLIQENRTKKTR